MDHLLYGAAYYDEYMPCDRLEKDMSMMEKAGMNVIRIAESTWSTEEPSDGIFDFSHVTRVLDAAARHGIGVIIGTPTYAVPAWLVKKYPEILAVTKNGRGIYGARQIMDITNPDYLRYAERIIRRLMEACSAHPAVIGFQLDNETKYYDTAGPGVQARFLEYLKMKFHGSCAEMNAAYGLAYWSNAVFSWEDFPDVRGTINGSLAAEFDRFRRGLVEEFLKWEASIVREYKKEDQFITHNFDFEWRGYSFGLQPAVNHRRAAEAVTVAGCDIYHPSQGKLTGAEIAFCGDLARSFKNDNYYVLETQAQGYPCWTPYPGQLRLQAYSHLAGGADAVEYWHWHSIHNSFETYWKGVLSHDLAENEVYREAEKVGQEWQKFGSHFLHLKKKNKAAILVSNDALTGLSHFPIDGTAPTQGHLGYNDVLRAIYDVFYKMNVECDFIWADDLKDPDEKNADRKAEACDEAGAEVSDIEAAPFKGRSVAEKLASYKLLIVPALYAAEECVLKRIRDYASGGGTLFATFKTGFADENIKVYPDKAPHILSEVIGAYYQEFTFPQEKDSEKWFMELLIPESGRRMLSYNNPEWKAYAAAVRNDFGKGHSFYIGCMPEEEKLKSLAAAALQAAGISKSPNVFPVIVRSGINAEGRRITWYFNYSGEEQTAVCESSGRELFSGTAIEKADEFLLPPWKLAAVIGADGIE